MAGRLVVVERGKIKLKCLAGTGWRFERDDVLWSFGPSVHVLHNPGRERRRRVIASKHAL